MRSIQRAYEQSREIQLTDMEFKILINLYPMAVNAPSKVRDFIHRHYLEDWELSLEESNAIKEKLIVELKFLATGKNPWGPTFISLLKKEILQVC